jgi:hypothetical protein
MWALVSRVGLVHWDGQRWRREDADNQIPVNLLWMLKSESEPGRLWIGSEGGVTQFDGRTWGTLSQDDGLQSATVYAIVRTDDGGHWIGGATGLTYYVPDSTPPWVRLEGKTAGSGGDARAGTVAQMGSDIAVTFDAGDLQTLQPNLYVLQRLVSAASTDSSDETSAGMAGLEGAETVSWVQSEPGVLNLPSLDAGAYELQVVARDQSFNYSDVLRVPIEVFVPPPTVNVPGLGRIDPSIFAVILILGVLSILGAGFVMFEVMHRRNRSVAALNRGFNPYISGEPVRSQKMFYGRRDLVQRIADTLHNNSVMIHGERRIGKTTLLYQLALLLREVNDPEYWFVPVYVDLEGTPQDHFFHLLIEEIAVAVAKLPEAETVILPYLADLQFRSLAAEAYDDRAFQRDLHQVSDVLIRYGQVRQPGKQLRLILLVDEMDVMSHYDSIIQQQLRRIFMREFASTVGAVVAGIRISKEWDRIESPWYNMFNEIELEPFTEEEAHALLIEPVAGYYRYDDDALDFILTRSQGRPYRVQQYGLEAVNHMLAGRRRKVNVGDAHQAHERISSAPDLDIGLDASDSADRAIDDANE